MGELFKDWVVGKKNGYSPSTNLRSLHPCDYGPGTTETRSLLTLSLLISEDVWVLLPFPGNRNVFSTFLQHCDRCET